MTATSAIEDGYNYPEYPLPYRLIAAAVDCHPSEIDRTDGSYQEVIGLLAEHDHASLLALANAMSLEGDWGVDDVEEAVTNALHEYARLRAVADAADAYLTGGCSTAGLARLNAARDALRASAVPRG
jgi:hypothetical protein